jgi:5-methylcytosine-specific restriction endonuclease McrA
MAIDSVPPTPIAFGSGICKKTPCPYHVQPQFGGEREHFIRRNLLHDKGCQCAKCLQPVDFYESDLHHTNPNKKRFTLNQGTIKSILDGMGMEKGMKKIQEEADKCILVCRDCHKEIHSKGLKEFFDRDYWPFMGGQNGKRKGLDKVA